METIAASIALKVVSGFIKDAVTSAIKGEEASPLAEAIESTARYFSTLEGLPDSLRRWLRNQRVIDSLEAYVLGHIGQADLSISDLASVLTGEAQFYFGDASDSAAAAIVGVFLQKLRTAYLSDANVGNLHIANRQEKLIAGLAEQIQTLSTSVETQGGAKTLIQTHFDEAVARFEAEDFQGAKVLFESLVVEMEKTSTRDRALQRRVHINLGNLYLRFFDEENAAKHLRLGAELDDNQERALLNIAAANLVQKNFSEALGILDRSDAVGTPALAFERSASRVKALLGLKRYDEATEIATSIDAGEKELQRLDLLAVAYRESGRLGDAERSTREALALKPSNPDLKHVLACVVIAPAIDFHNQNPLTDLPQALKSAAEEAATLLETASVKFREQGRVDAALEADSNLAVIRALQSRFTDVIHLLLPVTQSRVAVQRDWLALGFAYMHTSEPSLAVMAFHEALSKDQNADVEFLYAEALSVAGRHSEAMKFASEKLDSPIVEIQVRWLLVLARSFWGNRQFGKARAAVEEALVALPGNAEALLCSAELYDATGQHDLAAKTFDEALQVATGAVEIRIRGAFGSFAARRKDFARAAELWKPLVRVDTPNSLLDDFVRVAFNSKKYGDITSIAKASRESGTKTSLVFADVAAAAYERLDELTEACYWLEYLGNLYGNRPEHIVRLSNIKLRLGKRDEAVELLHASRAALQTPKELIGYAQSFSILGEHRAALEIGYSATNIGTDADTQLAYVDIFLAVPDNIDRSEDEIAKFQDILLKYKERFPNSSSLQSFQVDPDHPLENLREMLTNASSYFNEVADFYKSKRPPISTFARLLRKDLYQVWLIIISNPELRLYSADGTAVEIQESRLILTTEKAFIVEPLTLFVLSWVNLLDKLASIGEIYVSQRVMDHLQELQARRRTADRETGIMGIDNGEMFVQSIAPEDAARTNAALNNCTEWAFRNAKIVGLVEPLTGDERQWEEAMGAPAVATMAVAKQRSLPLITDDKAFGNIARQNSGVRFLNTQALLAHLLELGTISEDVYDGAIVRLFEAGYAVTHVNDSQLFSVMMEDQFQLTPRVKSAMLLFKPSSISLLSASFVVSGLITRLYAESMPQEMKEELSLHALNTLAVNHSKAQIKRLVKEFVQQRLSPMQFLRAEKIELLLTNW